MFDFHLHLSRLGSPVGTGRELISAGIGFNNVACEPWEWEDALRRRDEFTAAVGDEPKVQFAFGVHPMIASKVLEVDWLRLEEILRSGADQVGECGLDRRFEGYGPGEVQEQVFRRQAALAKELGLPLQVHCVGDYHRIFNILDALDFGVSKTKKEPSPTIILHRFGGDISVVKGAQKFNVLFSLHEDSFRKRATVEAIKAMPLELVRFETDADESLKTGQEDHTGIAKMLQEKLRRTEAQYRAICGF